MPGLSFLSKKSWHTSNIKNVEKVWIAEQKADQERKKLDELQKQLEEERQIQELRQLQVAHGQVVKTVDTSLDWMYEGPSASSVQSQQTEEYLLGKVFNQGGRGSTFDVSNPLTDHNKNAGQQRWMEKISTKTDVFSRMHEDPLLIIKQKEKQQRDQVLINPIKMSQIRQNIARELEEHQVEKDKKRDRKHRKESKEKKSKKEKKREKDVDDDDLETNRTRRRKYENERDESSDREAINPNNHSETNFKYGLQNKEVIKKDYLGPRPELLEERDTKRRREAEDRRRVLDVNRMTYEQKEEKLKKMTEYAEMKYSTNVR